MDLKITGAKLSGDAEKDIKILANHVFQLEEQLRYQLRNLDVTNFNDLGLARYENGRMQFYAKQVEIQAEKLRVEFGKETDEIRAQFEATVDGFKATVEGYGNDVKGYGEQVDGYARQVSSFNQTVSGFNTTVTNYGNAVNGYSKQVASFEQTANKISAVVSAVDDSNGNVTAASIVAAINNAGSTVKISADHVDISGFVTFSDLSTPGATTISGANIETGTISADTIYGGTLSGVRFESWGNPAWADPLAGGQSVTIEDGGISISGVNLGRTFAGGFTIELTDGTKYEFTPGGIYLDGSRIA